MRDDRIQYTRHPNLRQHVISRFKNRTNHALPNPDISLATDRNLALALPRARERGMMLRPRSQRLLSRHDGADHARMRTKSTESNRRKGGEKMASALQLPREELLRAYRQMRT